MTSIETFPQNSLIAVMDPSFDGAWVPEHAAPCTILSTPHCIVVPTLCSADGPTRITLGRAGEVAPGGSAVFDGVLETPSRHVVIRDVLWKEVARVAVPWQRTRIRISSNHAVEPDDIRISAGGAGMEAAS
jgi:hypothetical protein